MARKIHTAGPFQRPPPAPISAQDKIDAGARLILTEERAARAAKTEKLRALREARAQERSG